MHMELCGMEGKCNSPTQKVYYEKEGKKDK